MLSQGEPRDAAGNFNAYRLSNFTTASCGFSATARLSSCIAYIVTVNFKC